MKKTLLPLVLLPLLAAQSFAETQTAQTEPAEAGKSESADSVIDRINADLKEKGVIDDEYLENKDKKYAYSEVDMAMQATAKAKQACEENSQSPDCPQGEAPMDFSQFTAANIAKMQQSMWDNIKHPSDRTAIAIGLETDAEALFPSSGFYPPPQSSGETQQKQQ